MAREDEIRSTIKQQKRPSSKTYVIIFVLLVAALAFYFLVAGTDLGTTFFGGINSPAEAQQTSSDISSGVRDVSSDLDDISQILGIS